MKSNLNEALRRADAGCALRARWLGIPCPPRQDRNEQVAEERRRRMKELVRRDEFRPDIFNQR